MIGLPPARHSEAAFETVLEAHLLDHGYTQIVSGYDRERAIFPDLAIQFIRATQPKGWAKLEALFVERMDQNEEIFGRYMNDRAFQKVVADLLATEVYEQLTGGQVSRLKYS